MDRATLEGLEREQLVVEARRVGVKRAEVMTRVELVDEVLRLGTPNPVERKKVRGWLGVARDLLASAVELGLNLPDAAAMIRGDIRFEPLRGEHPPVATVTLAEIYGAQGHVDRALGILDEVLEREPDHEIARRLRTRLAGDGDAKRAKVAPDAPEDDPDPAEPFPVDDEPDHVTAIPVVGSFFDDEPDHATLVPMRPEVRTFEDDGSEEDGWEEDDSEMATLVPAKPEPFELAEDEPDHATLVPVRPAPVFFETDDSDALTLFPAARAPHDDDDGPDLPTLPPSMPASTEPGFEAAGPPTLLPASTNGAAEDDDDLPTNPPAPPAEERTTLAEGPRSAPAIVFARTGAGSASVYFELGELTGEAMVLRVVEHRVHRSGVERIERDFPVKDSQGTATISDLEGGSILRVALGRKFGGRFFAHTVAAELSFGSAGVNVAWAPRRGVDYAAVADRSGLSR